MFKESLICIIVSIILYQLYLEYFKKEKNSIDNKKIKPEKVSIEPSIIKPVERQRPMVYETPNSFVHPQLGKPDKILPEGYLFIIDNPNPWNAIIYNENKEENYLFILKVRNINSYTSNYQNNLKNWKSIIPNINFDLKTGELIIPASDENFGLAVANLLLSNFKNDIDFKNIMENSLIQISIQKLRSHQSVRIKIVEQILENTGNSNQSLTDTNPDYEEDLADTATASVSVESPEMTEQKKDNEIISAYEGGEFSFIN